MLAIGTDLFLKSCNSTGNKKAGETAIASDGPVNMQQPEPQTLGDAARGHEVFRFETFGNEAFWFNAMRMQQGMEQAKVTPKMMLALGLHIDMEAVEPTLKQALEAEFKTDLTMQNAPLLNDPKTTAMLIMFAV